MIVIHIARIRLDYSTGMGRISAIWKESFEKSGHTFLHIGMQEVPHNVHSNLWGFYARRYLSYLKVKPDVVLVHEPHGGFFIDNKYRTVVFSHGIEERAWEVQRKYSFQKRSIKSYLLPTYIRFLSNNRGLKYADLVLLSNTTDKFYLENKAYNRPVLNIFRNGYFSFEEVRSKRQTDITILFNGSWIERKGVCLIVSVFNRLIVKYPNVNLILAGTSVDESDVLSKFNVQIRGNIRVIKQFSDADEILLYANASVFILPSYFEGQSLALTQAMAMGLCPVVSDNSGQIDFVKHMQNGLLFETGNAESLHKQLVYLIENNHLIEKYGVEARRSVVNFEWNIVGDDIVKKVFSIV